MSAIEHVHARQILDSRGNPTSRSMSGSRPAPGPRRGALGRLDRDPGGARAARRRTRVRRQGREPRVENVNGEIAEAVRGLEPPISAALDEAMIALDGTDGKTRLGANAILGVSMAARARRRRGGGRAAVALPGRRGGEPAARADDERPQRRRPRRQSGRLPGVHDRAGRRRLVRGGDADGRRGLPRAPAHAEAARTRHGGRATREASRRRSTRTRRRSSCS